MTKRISNIQKMIAMSASSWKEASACGLTHIRASYTDSNKIVDDLGHAFINMCSCSYLGLDRHPAIIQGAINALEQQKTLQLPTSRTRIGSSMLDEVEQALGELFGCEAIVTLSCATASSGLLPLLASGCLTNDEKPVMIFDKLCHFSMHHMKSSCLQETEIHTCEHNDLAFIESMCQQHKRVVYVADGAYSMGGFAPIKALQALQQKYGLFLYFDDSHALSAVGEHGVGFVRSQYDELDERTIIVSSLGKAFGATGGVVLYANPGLRYLIDVYAGPMGWSQTVNNAGLGAIKAAVEIHQSPLLAELQQQLRNSLDTFDTLIPTQDAGNGLPVRVVEINEPSRAIHISGEVFRRGYYSSAVFFPIVAKGRAGLRVMPRADLSKEDISGFCAAIDEFRFVSTSSS